MIAFSDELRLALVILLNASILITAYRFVRDRSNQGIVQAICDALLLYFLIQYASVALPGTLGIFSTWTMSAVALAAAAAMEGSRFLSSYSPPPTLHSPPPRRDLDHFALLACTLFTAGFLGSYAYVQRFVPPVSTDALVYHLPTAVQWIQTGRLGIYPSWYWNPAASYSPGTGSIFMAWWMAPAGNDVFVRFVQLPPLMFIFFLVVRMSRLLGATRATAGLIAVAATLSRPLFSEAVFQKDDLFVTAFISAAVLSLAEMAIGIGARPSSAAAEGAERTRTSALQLGRWRVGVAFGFVLASKYTALLACPVFLFMIDAPFRARWKIRHCLIAIGIATVMAFGWYLRNIILTGNPLYPVDMHIFGLHLKGLFITERDEQLRSAGGVWRMLAETYHSLPLPVIALLIVGCAWAAFSSGKAILLDPLRRACTIGSIATIAIFLTTSPHHEVRYLFPLIVLLFAGVSVQRKEKEIPSSFFVSFVPFVDKSSSRFGRIDLTLAALLAAASILTSLDRALIIWVAAFAGAGLAIAMTGVGLVYLQTRAWRLTSGNLALLASSASALIAIAAYVQWHAYVREYREIRSQAWAGEAGYPLQGPLWKWVDGNTPAEASLAYANTFFVYPYYGFNFTRKVAYAPVRRGLSDFLHFPRMGEKIPGDLIVRRMTEVMDANADRETWMANLRSIKADYLIVMKGNTAMADLDSDPPELRFARQEPGRFHVAYEDEAGIVYQIDWR